VVALLIETVKKDKQPMRTTDEGVFEISYYGAYMSMVLQRSSTETQLAFEIQCGCVLLMIR